MGNKETKSEEMLVIENITEKEGKSGRKFYVASTDKGQYSVFEYDIVDELKMHIGDKGEFECAQRDNFYNIRKVIQWVEQNKAYKKPLLKTPESNGSGLSEVQSAKDISIYTSYAKDIFMQLCVTKEDYTKENMAICCELVKQARDAFK